MSRAAVTQRPCPICGIALIAAEPRAEDGGNSILQCPRCGLVIDVSVPAGKTAGREDPTE